MREVQPVPFTEVKLEGAFWRERIETVLDRTIASQYEQLVSHNMISELDGAQPPPPLTIPRGKHNFTTQIFWDSDLGKWIEAASYALAHRRDTGIEAKIDHIADKLAEMQLPDGYLNIWYITREPGQRWTNLRDNHELYNCGHLLEGAIAYFRATGRRKLLDVMERCLDHIGATFGPGEGQKRGYCGHPEIELALIRLYHLTGDKKRLDLAAYFVDERGRQAPHYYDVEARARGEDPGTYWAGTYEYCQAHKPVREQDKVVGHAVRAFYLFTAMADLAAELDDDGLRRVCEALWADATGRRMYVTAGFGPSARNEGFTSDYDLPNDSAYAETCASVAMIFWAQRMLHIDLDGRYADVLERALYNGALSGLSRDGTHYFYENKLESDGSHRRWTWHPCPCCTMNAARLIASVAGYYYSTAPGRLIVHLYGGASTTLEVSGVPVRLVETSDYPWSGRIGIEISPDKPHEFALQLRIPDWATGAKANVNGLAVDIASASRKGYLTIRRIWKKRDKVELDLPMPPERLFAHPAVKSDRGQAALRRGPLVYCVEAADNPGMDLALLHLPRETPLAHEKRSDLFGGTVVLTAKGRAAETAGWDGVLYRSDLPPAREAQLTAVPYFLWANREPGAMRVWISEN